MALKYGYVGSTEVSKAILESSSVNPEVVVSFSDSHRDRISGFATYPEYGDRWIQIDSINDESTKRQLRKYDLDILLVMAWQELLNEEVLSLPEVGCVGRHLSLLPKRRGRAPVAWALIHGLTETGVTLFWLDEGVDSGDIVVQQSVPIDHEDEAHDLHEKMTDTSVALLDDVLPKFEEGTFPRTPQNTDEATYTHPRRPDMGLIDWERSASTIYNFIRGQTRPYPGAFTYHKMDKVTVWHASIDHPTAVRGQVGEILETMTDDELLVQTGNGTLQIEAENHDGSYPIEKGNVLGCLP
ncbi:methionyl-tRNA formyltransferase [Halorussus amylolyticus]|uniref:methionyl-tRNA formyltransferase n=1 Tax=Halorussus amylolyticus TaxID=1126242 RepID=UPI00104FA849|nr:methionyl-tRNA formyltransferase [Halorussus amylolyticus]